MGLPACPPAQRGVPSRASTEPGLKRVFVTGANGYVGGALTRALVASAFPVLGGVRNLSPLASDVTPLVTGDLAVANLQLDGVRAVVHAAGLAHKRGVTAAVWQQANVDASVTVARAALAAGVERFIFISTIGVYGRSVSFTVDEASPLNPQGGYALSKLQAETALREILGARLTIIRPAAVIGPNCPGNLQLLMKLLAKGIPLPFAAIKNQRSFIDADDLARLVVMVLNADAAPELAIAASPETIATPQLIRLLAEGMATEARLLAFPPSVLAFGARLLGRGAIWQSLAGSFAADPKAALKLGWTPRQPLRQSLLKTGQAYTVS